MFRFVRVPPPPAIIVRPTAREALDHPWIQAGLSYSDEELWYPPDDSNGRGVRDDAAAGRRRGEEEDEEEEDEDEDVLDIVGGILEDIDDEGSELMMSRPFRRSL